MSFKNLAKLINEANKEKTPEQEFMHIFNETLVRLQKPRQPSKTYKPSSLGGCIRKMYFEVTGAPVDKNSKVDPVLIGIMENGTDRHERIQTTITKMKELGYDVEWVDVGEYLKSRPQEGTRVVQKQGMETKLRNDVLNLSFMCDGIIKFNGVYYILEIKTEVSFKWQSRTQPVDKHIVQASAYSTCLGIDKVMFLYENRDMCGKKVFITDITDNMKNDNVIHTIETCNSYIDSKEVPPKTTKKNECKYCNFLDECKKY